MESKLIETQSSPPPGSLPAKPLFSFIICSWQAPATIEETLASIGRNAATSDISCEVVLVNNGFSQARAAQLKAAFPGVRTVDEPKPGLTAARVAGYGAATGEYLICLDDDNVIAVDFSRVLADLVQRHRRLGGVCAVVTPRWERTPPRWLQEFGTCCLSYNSVDLPSPDAPRREHIWVYPRLEGCAWPPGGGMIIHRSLAEDYLRGQDSKRARLGRNRNSLGGSEDQDIFGRVFSVGRDVAFSDRLLVWHIIPQSRIRWRYLVRLNFRMCQDWAVLARIWRREKHPFFHSSPRDHAMQIPREFFAWAKGHLTLKRLILEWIRHAGFLWGWAWDARRQR